MKRTIQYSRTVGSNEGMPDYSNKIMSAEVELDEGVTIEEGLITLQYAVDKALGLIKEEAPKPTTKKKASKKKTSKKKAATKKPVEVDESGEEWYDDSEPVTSDSPVQEETVVEDEKPATKKKTTKKKTTRKKITAIPYDNTVDKHKKLIGDLTAEILDKDWTKDKDKKSKVRVSAKKMVGKDFINKEGEVTEEFKKEYSELLNA